MHTSDPLAERRRRRPWTLVMAFAVAVSLVFVAGPMPQARAHSGTQKVKVYNPVVDGDSVHTDVTARWATTPGTQPSSHHIVYSNWGWPNDWSVDIFGPAGRRVVTPFGSSTTNGHPTVQTVIDVKPGCASGRVSDGGYRVTIQVKDKVTGDVLGRADLMHVSNPQVSPGDKLGPWTTIGYLAKFNLGRWSSCYQVTTSAGVHLHLEIINKHRYACYYPRANGAALTGLTVIGKVATHKSGQRATCG